MPSPVQAPDQPARVLGTLDATCVVIGAIIGVGIFFNPSRIAAITGDGTLALAAWGVGGLIALAGALTFAELGGRVHSSGAQYEILRDAYGSFPAFLFVFCNATAVQAGAIGVIAVVCVNNLLVATGIDAGSEFGGTGQLLGACVLILGVMSANAAGVRAGAWIQNFTVFAKVGTLLAVVLIALAFRPVHEPFIGPLPTAPVSGAFPAILAALIPIFFALGGWQHALWISGEVRDPQRILPRAIIIGVLIVIAVYLLANWAYLALLGVENVATSRTLAADAVASVFSGPGGRVIAGAVALSAFGVLNAQLLSGPRLIFGMARDGRFFPWFGKLDPRTGTPVGAIVLLGGMGIGLLLAAGFKRVDYLTTGVVFIDGVFFALTGAALFTLRRRGPGPAGAFRVPWYPIVPAIFVLGEFGVIAGAYIDPEMRSAAVIGVGWILLAAILYVVRFRTRAPLTA